MASLNSASFRERETADRMVSAVYVFIYFFSVSLCKAHIVDFM